MCAAISDGTYVIHNAKNSGLALDVSCGLDDSGINVQVYTVNGTDAQIVQVLTYNSHRHLRFPLTGKFVDVYSNTIANGTNVWQYTENHSDAQSWDIVDAGTTTSYGGTTYNNFRICVGSNNSFCMDVIGSDTPTAGSNVDIWAVGSHEVDPTWFFVKVNLIPDGVYSIRSAMDTNICVDVTSAGMNNGTPMQLWTNNGTNAQKFYFKTLTDGTTVVHSLLQPKADEEGNITYIDKVMDANPDDTNGSIVHIWDCVTDSTTNLPVAQQRWVITQEGVITENDRSSGRLVVRNGVPMYVFRSVYGNNKVLDATGMSSSIGNRLQKWDKNGSSGTTNQLWTLHRETLEESVYLIVPSDVRFSYMANRLNYRDGRGLWINDSGSSVSSDGKVWTNHFNVNFLSDNAGSVDNQFTMRYRVRYITNGTTNFGGWSNWKSIQDGSEANHGLGSITEANCVTSNTGTTRWSSQTVPVTLGVSSGYANKANFEVQVRQSYSSAQVLASGQTVVSSGKWCDQNDIYVYIRPVLTFTDLTYSTTGLMFSFDSNVKTYATSTLTVSVYDPNLGKYILKNVSTQVTSDGGTIEIPYSNLAAMPYAATPVTISYTYSNRDTTTSGTATSNLSFNSSHGLIAEPTISYNTDYGVVDLTFDKGADSNGCYLLIQHPDGTTTMDPMPLLTSTSSKVTYRCYPAFGKQTLYMTMAKSSATVWGSYSGSITALQPTLKGHMWSDIDHPWNAPWMIKFNVDNPPKMGRELKGDSKTVVTTGRTNEVVTFGRTVSSSFTVDGILVAMNETNHEVYDTSIEDGHISFQTLAYQGALGNDIIYRSPWGDWAHVAVTDISMPKTWNNRSEVSVTMTEVTP